VACFVGLGRAAGLSFAERRIIAPWATEEAQPQTVRCTPQCNLMSEKEILDFKPAPRISRPAGLRATLDCFVARVTQPRHSSNLQPHRWSRLIRAVYPVERVLVTQVDGT
jgi:hypothetical protein